MPDAGFLDPLAYPSRGSDLQIINEKIPINKSPLYEHVVSKWCDNTVQL